jgi:hypothetical protein
MVKSTYHYTIESLVDNSEQRVEGNWMKIWRLLIAQKVKVFLWRAVKGCISTRHVLQTRGVHCSDRCAHSDSSYENDWHVFFACAKLEQVWSAMGNLCPMAYYTREIGNR